MTGPPAPEETAPADTIPCPRCGKPVPQDQEWCLECGYAARTRIARSPRWRIPIVVATVVAVLALAGIAVAFVDLTEDPEGPPSTTPATAPTTVPPTTTAPPTVPATPPATTPTVPSTTPTVPTTPQTVPSTTPTVPPTTAEPQP